VNGEPVSGGANFQADGPTAKPVLESAMKCKEEILAYFDGRFLRTPERTRGSVMVVLVELRGSGLRRVRLKL
jgi:hypothetical protein